MELKPCPFCGCVDKPTMEKIPLEETFYISCWNCGSQSGYGVDRQNAIKEWNTRAYEETMTNKKDPFDKIIKDADYLSQTIDPQSLESKIDRILEILELTFEIKKKTPPQTEAEISLECYRCGSPLHGEIDTDNRILVKHCAKCVSEIARLLDSKRQQTQRPGSGHKLA